MKPPLKITKRELRTLRKKPDLSPEEIETIRYWAEERKKIADEAVQICLRRMRHDYMQEKNPVCVFEAIAYCEECNLVYPKWVRSYLAKVAGKILKNDGGKRLRDKLPSLLDMAGANRMAEHQIQQRNWLICREYRIIKDKNPALSKTEIANMILEEQEIDNLPTETSSILKILSDKNTL